MDNSGITSHIKTKEDFFSESLLGKLREFTFSNPPLRSNITSWEDYLVGSSAPILIQDIDGELKENIVDEVKNNVDVDFSDCIFSCSYVLGTRGSFLQWHNDGNHNYTITVFMNEMWCNNFGGAFMYQIDGSVTAIYPQRNKAILMLPPIDHGTSITSQDAPIRQTVQIFIDKKNPNQ